MSTDTQDSREVVEIVARAAHAGQKNAPWPDLWWHEDPAKCRLSRHVASAILTAIEASGWKIVPVEPTEEMVERGVAEVAGLFGSDDNPASTSHNAYAAMLSASPKVTRGTGTGSFAALTPHPPRTATKDTTMATADELKALADRCEWEKASRYLDQDIEEATQGYATNEPLYYTTSLDAAVTLMGERGWGLTWDLESVHAGRLGLPNDIGVCAYVWLDHMTNEKSFISSPPVETFGEAVKWLPRLICALALRARAALSPTDGAPADPPKVRTPQTPETP